jgi:hypothetical protein
MSLVEAGRSAAAGAAGAHASRRRLMVERIGTKARVALVAIGMLVAIGAFVACGGDDDEDPDDAQATMPPPAAASAVAEPTERSSDELGSTPGWGGGATAEVFYTKDFFCDADPCQAGAAGANAPGTSDPVPSVWVLVPLFQDTEGIDFHCPETGACVAHPMSIDVSAIGLGDVIPLPPHSHIVDPNESGFSAAGETPWKVVVVGVNTRPAWDMLEQGKSLETLRTVQEDSTAATADIPTNIVLFFGIR